MNRAHAAVAATFLAFGIGMGLWAGASAFVLARSGVAAGGFGVALTLQAIGYLCAMAGGGTLARLVSLRRILTGAVACMGLVLAALLQSAAPVAIYLNLALVGLIAGLVDLIMNAEGTRVEAELARPILAGLHGAASVGLALGAIAGSLIAVRFGTLPVGLIILLVFAATVLLIACATPERGLSPLPAKGGAPQGIFTRPLVILGLVLGTSMAGESAAMTWSTSLLAQDAPRLAEIAGAGATFFAICQASMRFCADALRARIADRVLMTVSLAIAACGYGLVALHVSFTLSLIGFAIIGIGTGAIVPCGFALAVAASRLPAASALSVVTTVAGLPRLPAPLAMGAIAAQLSFAGAFGLFTLLFAAAFVLLALTLRAPSPATLESVAP